MDVQRPVARWWGRMLTRCVLLTCLLWMAGCTSFAPRFPSNIAASFARDPMRRLETRSLRLYYPEPHRVEALRVAARLESCVDQLRAHAHGPEDDKLLVVMTSADFNNAYVSPMIPGQPQQMVLPEHVTLELFHWFGLGTADVGDIACHEAVHYVQLEQVGGVWGVLNTITGGSLQPNIFTETWFLEGLATYYEGRLGARVGRPFSPVFRGWWESGVASDVDGLNPGYLNPDHRAVLPFGANYQTGFAFVEYLAETYGEQKLWEYVGSVGSGITLNLGLTLRFKAVFGKSIGAAFDDFRDHLRRTLPQRVRPAGQQVLAGDLGYVARLATSPTDGAMAVVFEGRDQVSTLRVYERDGRLRLEQWLTPLLPVRPFIVSSPQVFSGLRFSADGASLFAVVGDLDDEGSYVSRLLRFDAHTGALVREWSGLHGLGGDVTPDGAAYVYVDVARDAAHLVRLDLASGTRTLLTTLPGGTSLAPPAVSPDGRRIALPRWQEGRFDLLLREEDGGLRALTSDVALDYAPRWVDAHRLVLLREHEGRAQVFLLDVEDGGLTRVTDAPYLAMDPGPLGGEQVAFLNRDGWRWTLDTVALPQPSRGLPAAATASAEETTRAAPFEEAGTVLATGARRQDDASGRSVQAQHGGRDAEATTAPTTAAAPQAGVEVFSDEPYSPLDGLFVPQLHVPFISSVYERAGRLGLVYGFSLAGADRLSLHNYLLDLRFDTQLQGPFISARYGNYQLAPWFLSAGFGRAPSLGATDWTLSVGASRSFWTTPVSFSLLGFQRDVRPGAQDVLVPGRLAGPRVGTEYFAGDGTPDGGLQRGLGVGLDGAVYATDFAGHRTVGDVRLELSTAVPAPLPNDSLLFTFRGRVLPNAPLGLLRVGGVSPAFSSLDFVGPQRQVADPLPNLGPLLFTESLRGYEDQEFAATRVAVGSARYRYSVIIDHGWASFLYLFPSFFVRQVDVEGFGTWAVTDGPSRLHRAYGGSVALRTVFGSALPFSLRYQLAYRADDRVGPLHLVSLAFE
jgi:hypothetical protein